MLSLKYDPWLMPVVKHNGPTINTFQESNLSSWLIIDHGNQQ